MRSETTRTLGRRSFIGCGVGSAAVALAFVLGPAASGASASNITANKVPLHGSVVNVIFYWGEPGERNFVQVQPSGGEYLFTESGGPTITSFPPFCSAVSPVQVSCPTSDSDGPFDEFDLTLGDGNDYTDVQTALPTTINGNGGSDVLNGGGGPDDIKGDGSGPVSPDGDDVLNGRGGADKMVGGDGVDGVTYAGRNSGVNVSLDGVANDGQPTEGDYVSPFIENVTGGSGGDVLTGNNSDNVLAGGEGQDVLTGAGGANQLLGGDQSDTLHGGWNNDQLSGQAGFDTLDGGSGDDQLLGGSDDDAMVGGGGADFMSGGDGARDYVDYGGVSVPLNVTVPDGAANDGAIAEHDNVQADTEVVFGGSGNDRLVGGDNDGELWGQGGNDQLFGGDNDDLLEGGDGDDRLEGGYRADILSGGNGSDTVDYTWHSFTDTSTGEVFGASSTPNGVADDGNFDIDGGLSGQDNVGADVENVIGSAGPDYLVGSGAGNRLRGGPHDDELHGVGGSDTLDGEGGADTLNGGPEADLLRGGDEEDRVLGGADDDTLDGGLGSDTLIGQAGIDTITYAGRAGPVAVTLDEVRNDGADPDGNGTSTLAEEGDLDRQVENATGGDGNDILRALVADPVVNVLRGGFGADVLDAREGTATADSLLCGPDVDGYRADPSDAHAGCETPLP